MRVKEQVLISNIVVCIRFGIFFYSCDDIVLKTLKFACNMKNVVMMMMMTTILVVMMTGTTEMLMAVMLVVMIEPVDEDNTLYIILTCYSVLM